MEDRDITVIAILISIIGLILLFLTTTLLSENQNYNDYIDLIKSENDDQIILEGKIVSARTNSGTSFIKIMLEEEIDIVVFEELYKKEDEEELYLGKTISIEGKINIHEKYGKSIIAEKIELIE
ncbi:MAG: OB-fold nucleic acid binding domain-containing protein [Nanoarchaeota archaeon]